MKITPSNLPAQQQKIYFYKTSAKVYLPGIVENTFFKYLIYFLKILSDLVFDIQPIFFKWIIEIL